MRINKKIGAAAALVVVALLAFVFLALPPLIKHFAVKKIDQATGRKSRIDKVSLNPFTLEAEVSGVRLSEKGSSAPFLAFSSARLSLSPLSLPKRSFIVKELHLASPYLHIVRNAPNSFNFSDLVSGKKKEKEEPKEGAPLFSINNITIQNGSIDFEDRALKEEKRHSVRGLQIAVPFVTNMPYLADRYVTPRLSAVVNGSPFRFDGKLKPLHKAVEATMALNADQIDLPFYLGYLPSPPPVQIASGKLGSALELGYRIDEKIGPELRLAGSLALSRLALKDLGGAPLAALDRADLKIRDARLLARRVDLSSLELDGVELHAARDRSGAWNFKSRGSSQEEKAAKPEAGEKKPLDLKLARFSLKNGKVHFSDAAPRGGFRSELKEIALSLENFSSTGGGWAPFTLTFQTERGESAAVRGELVPEPLAVKGNLALKEIPLKDYYPYLYETLTAPVTGTLNIATELLYNKEQGLVLERGELRGAAVAASFGSGEGITLKEAVISGIGLDLNRRKAAVDRVDLKGGKLTLSNQKEGGISAQRLLRSQKQTESRKTGEVTQKGKAGAKKEGSGFSYRVQQVTGSDFGIRFTDRSIPEEPLFALNRASFSLSGISGPRQGALPFQFSTGYGKAGRIIASGKVTPAPLQFQGSVDLQRIPLRDFDPYLNRNTNVFIANGLLDTKMIVQLQKEAEGFKGRFSGSLGVRSFYCQDTLRNEDLLKWERLQLERVSGTVGPFTLAINDVSLSNFYSRIIVEQDGTLNLQHLMVEEKAQGEAKRQAHAAGAAALPAVAGADRLPADPDARGTKAKEATRTTTQVIRQSESGKTTESTQTIDAKPAQQAPPASKPPPVRIDAVTLQGGTLYFSDRHLESPFDTTFFNLGGRVTGLSSQSNRFADVDLRGNLENHSPLAITGEINPLRGDLYLDLKIAFKEIELSPFTPYSDTYLGYDVDKGKLSLDLTYRIDKKALSSQNKVFIDQFTFGKQVESEKATKLPVKLAVALLKDRKGEIRLDLPVTGRTDDPQFSVWKVVGQMLKNLLVKVATSPVALLGSMMGDTEDYSAVYFAPGSARLAKEEKDKLMKLAGALADRPALDLEITGYVERERDAEGYRDEVLLKKMRGEKFRTLVKEGKSSEGQTQEETAILPEEYPKYLKAVYVKEKFPKPRNAFGLLKDLPEAEMRKLIITNTTAGNNELQALARERAQAVRAFLVEPGKVPAERLFEKSGDIYKQGAKQGSGSRVEFGASVK